MSEPPLPVRASSFNGKASFDGDFLTIERLAPARDSKRIHVAGIAAVQWKSATALTNGFIQFTVPGGNEARSRPLRGARDAARDENSVAFSRKSMPGFEALRDAVEAAIVRHGQPASPASQPDVMLQLEQLGKLRDAGVVSPEEFEAKKAELLARI
ncbi:DUF4429 domain-containing protein [Enterococcus hirae]|uniref:DUF4429 domain-containing protein n=1 Tax=Enterococcus hirae TaxID=1354 RepID=UPI00136A3980|nr:DUF4429 domain-containing protein [Enterococcus hirae]NAE18234.1 DUF4429 domain-containing protein [Enterococcus hirae]